MQLETILKSLYLVLLLTLLGECYLLINGISRISHGYTYPPLASFYDTPTNLSVDKEMGPLILFQIPTPSQADSSA